MAERIVDPDARNAKPGDHHQRRCNAGDRGWKPEGQQADPFDAEGEVASPVA